ncbi:hypothetical protein PoB_001010200 [Plakobranchus ocellatus]|uniref:Uncharacterized protein n=1 Tax=Plakobranchus ocellatus TaxID=259542 RepID=A0AAV3YL12_9GAST|nr:hypothetical protein PoB_001010200 [Plakobranchus ocellatus]
MRGRVHTMPCGVTCHESTTRPTATTINPPLTTQHGWSSRTPQTRTVDVSSDRPDPPTTPTSTMKTSATAEGDENHPSNDRAKLQQSQASPGHGHSQLTLVITGICTGVAGLVHWYIVN